ncbi:unnamed protein product [Blepharisma stoltei]|uniref:Uncharacterized protein n=1 Tax=Blepharisma stoltei TaxID=1481888 RepID=A0AAU9K2F9_9CILI|nr:unnamed protein product [Blepharisma stoltei]
MGIKDWFNLNKKEESKTLQEEGRSYSSSTRIYCLPDEEGITKCKKITTIRSRSGSEPPSEEIIEEEIPYDENFMDGPEFDEISQLEECFRKLLDPFSHLGRYSEFFDKEKHSHDGLFRHFRNPQRFNENLDEFYRDYYKDESKSIYDA